jgi:transposase
MSGMIGMARWCARTSPEQRLAVRQIDSALLVSDLRNWFETASLPGRSPTAEAISYALNHWEGLARFLHDGRIEFDSNSVERSMRPIALGRKNASFAGSDEGAETWACLCAAECHGAQVRNRLFGQMCDNCARV